MNPRPGESASPASAPFTGEREHPTRSRSAAVGPGSPSLGARPQYPGTSSSPCVNESPFAAPGSTSIACRSIGTSAMDGTFGTLQTYELALYAKVVGTQIVA